jgi:hypothetical protein
VLPHRSSFLAGEVPFYCRELDYTFFIVVSVCSHDVQDFDQNELYAAHWISTFIKHACSCKDDTDIEAEKALSSLVTGNEKLLVEVITPDVIHEFERLVSIRVCVVGIVTRHDGFCIVTLVVCLHWFSPNRIDPWNCSTRCVLAMGTRYPATKTRFGRQYL